MNSKVMKDSVNNNLILALNKLINPKLLVKVDLKSGKMFFGFVESVDTKFFILRNDKNPKVPLVRDFWVP